MKHPDFKEILRYASDSASDEEILEIDMHMVDCKECRDQVEGLMYLSENFETIWRSFTIAKYAELQRQLKYVGALINLTNAYPQIKEKMKMLYSNIKEGLALSAKILINPVQKLSLISSGDKKELLQGRGLYLNPLYAGMGDENCIEDEQKLEEGRKYLKNDLKDKAVDLLMDVSKSNPELVESSKLYIKLQDEEVGYIEINSHNKTVEIMFWKFEEGNSPTLVILKDSSEKEMLVEFERDDNDYLIAKFNIEEGIHEIKII